MAKPNEDYITKNRTFQGPRKKYDHASGIADHVNTTSTHDIKWDHFDILASSKTDIHCKIKETVVHLRAKAFPVSSEKLFLYQLLLLMMSRQVNVLLQIIFLNI